MHALPPTIAIVEDDLPLQELFVDLFSDEGYRVVCHSDSSSLLRTLAHALPALILIDLNPHDYRGGLPILAALRQCLAAAHVPVILMTTNVALLAAHAEPIRELRAVVQTRPFNIVELLANVVAAIGVLCTSGPPSTPGSHHTTLALPSGAAAAS